MSQRNCKNTLQNERNGEVRRIKLSVYERSVRGQNSE